ncbi:MAG TPA: hypothetical protein VFE61_26825 [Candidatus Sulfotelmatobacter sp.]|nr:hypothetical protein [Candidatus Sulfotelmatobacter sp.]
MADLRSPRQPDRSLEVYGLRRLEHAAKFGLDDISEIPQDFPHGLAQMVGHGSTVHGSERVVDREIAKFRIQDGKPHSGRAEISRDQLLGIGERLGVR